MSDMPETVSSRDFMHGDDDRMTGRGNHSGGLPFGNYARAMKELRYLNAIRKHGPRVADIARSLGVTDQSFGTWLVDATHRWPIYEDDKGGIYYGKPRT